MTLSWTELVALATKAARGAGAPAGQAAQFGTAAAVHLDKGRSAQDLTAALDALPMGPIPLVPIHLRALLGTAQNGILTTEVETAALSCGDQLLCSYVDALPYAHEVTPQSATVHLWMDTSDIRPLHNAARLTVPPELYDLLTAAAAQTFVPDTAASREGGAGAGLTDND